MISKSSYRQLLFMIYYYYYYNIRTYCYAFKSSFFKTRWFLDWRDFFNPAHLRKIRYSSIPRSCSPNCYNIQTMRLLTIFVDNAVQYYRKSKNSSWHIFRNVAHALLYLRNATWCSVLSVFVERSMWLRL